MFDGTLGTEYECLQEILKNLEAKKLLLEERIELMRRRMELAEGHP